MNRKIIFETKIMSALNDKYSDAIKEQAAFIFHFISSMAKSFNLFKASDPSSEISNPDQYLLEQSNRKPIVTNTILSYLVEHQAENAISLVLQIMLQLKEIENRQPGYQLLEAFINNYKSEDATKLKNPEDIATIKYMTENSYYKKYLSKHYPIAKFSDIAALEKEPEITPLAKLLAAMLNFIYKNNLSAFRSDNLIIKIIAHSLKQYNPENAISIILQTALSLEADRQLTDACGILRELNEPDIFNVKNENPLLEKKVDSQVIMNIVKQEQHLFRKALLIPLADFLLSSFFNSNINKDIKNRIGTEAFQLVQDKNTNIDHSLILPSFLLIAMNHGSIDEVMDILLESHNEKILAPMDNNGFETTKGNAFLEKLKEDPHNGDLIAQIKIAADKKLKEIDTSDPNYSFLNSISTDSSG